MKTDHIPILSYVFIGVTSLVLTYATIADTTNEIILPPTLAEPEPDVAPESQSSSVLSSIKEIELPSLSGTIEKLKSLNLTRFPMHLQRQAQKQCRLQSQLQHLTQRPLRLRRLRLQVRPRH